MIYNIEYPIFNTPYKLWLAHHTGAIVFVVTLLS